MRSPVEKQNKPRSPSAVDRRSTSKSGPRPQTSPIAQLQGVLGNQAMQRVMHASTCSCGGTCPACRQAKADVQNAAQHVPSIVNDSLKSGGQPLDRSTRAFYEPKFGHDFSRVRVHSDQGAAQSARALSAHAYTVGQNVVFGAGKYSPATDAGRRLLGHELAHVVQQSRGGATPQSGGAMTGLETQADSAAAAAMTGTGRANVRGATSTGLQMNAEAYVWNPHVDGFGHAALKLCDGTYISWWPAGGGDKKQQYWSGRPGGPHSYATDVGPGGEGMAPDDTYDLGCNCLDEKAIKDWYDTEFISNPDPKWAVLQNSCSDVARRALNVGSSVTNPCYASISDSHLFWTPKDFGSYAECQSRWCKAKAAGALNATGRYLWENTKELAGGAAVNTAKSLWWKAEIIKKAVFD